MTYSYSWWDVFAPALLMLPAFVISFVLLTMLVGSLGGFDG